MKRSVSSPSFRVVPGLSGVVLVGLLAGCGTEPAAGLPDLDATVIDDSGSGGGVDGTTDDDTAVVPDTEDDTTVPDVEVPDTGDDTTVPDAEGPDTGDDTTVPDTEVPDTGDDTTVPDVEVPDTGDDTTVPDVEVPDTGDDTTVPDTDVPDTVADTTVPDTTVEDTTAPDTTAPDVTPVDTGVDVADTTVVDVRPDAVVDTGVDVADAPDTVDVDTGVDILDVVDADTGPIVEPPMPTGPLTGLTGPPYLMWVTEDSVSVRWETATPSIGTVLYGPNRAIANRAVEPVARTSHEIRLTGLRPGEVTYYRVQWGDTGVPTRQFRTAPPRDENEPFRFVVWGDNQNGPTVFRDIVDGMREVDPAFGMVAGDCVQNGTRSEYRSQLFVPLSGFADQVPFMVGAGNHERYSDTAASLFDEYFSQPGDEHCFGWRYGMLYVVFVDTELGLRPGQSQYTCIDNALQTPEALSATYQAAIFHKPPRINFWFGGVLAFPDEMEEPDVRDHIEPLLLRRGVDIVFNGHNHLYAHSPETGGPSGSPEDGIVWVTTGGGGGTLDTDSFLWRVGRWPQITTQISQHHFLQVDVDSDVMIVTAIGRDGRTLHQFNVFPN